MNSKLTDVVEDISSVLAKVRSKCETVEDVEAIERALRELSLLTENKRLIDVTTRLETQVKALEEQVQKLKAQDSVLASPAPDVEIDFDIDKFMKARPWNFRSRHLHAIAERYAKPAELFRQKFFSTPMGIFHPKLGVIGDFRLVDCDDGTDTPSLSFTYDVRFRQPDAGHYWSPDNFSERYSGEKGFKTWIIDGMSI